MKKYLLLTIMFSVFTSLVWGQQHKGEIYGTVYNEKGNPMGLVNVAVIGKSSGTSTDKDGKYSLTIPANTFIKVAFSYLGYKREILTLRLTSGEKRKIDVNLEQVQQNVPSTTILGEKTGNDGMETIPTKETEKIPAPSGNPVQEMVKRSGLGVSANNELSSRYSVRGGNYDENLIYVNDIEIYRPFLVNSGKQEGLSFVNSDLVSDIKFSAGGFDAKYDDKMSSVLDITYKDPEEFEAGFEASLLGGSAYIQNSNDKKTLSYVGGLRYKTNQYLLNSLETSGEYQPNFLDFQGLVRWKPSPVFHVSFLGNLSDNQYQMIPKSRETRFGTINQALRFKVYFDGKEEDRFRTYNSALTFKYKPSEELELKLINAAYIANETETYDIQGQYWLDELKTDMGDEDFGSAGLNRGVGTYLHHARNYLNARVFKLKHVGKYISDEWNLRWGMKIQRELIDDKMWEWRMLDSAGYSLPHASDNIGGITNNNELPINELIIADNSLASYRHTGYLQNKWDLSGDTTDYYLTTGLRFHHWSVNGDWLVSPRVALNINPDWESDINYRISTGYYYQPPFYRELRGFDGELNKDIKAQKSIHFVAGQYWNFDIWDRPFRLATEVYYKHLENLIPYEVENLRIRYFADNMSHGYATGIDLKLHGEFVKGVQSYAGLSVMQTQEDIEGDYYYDYYNADGEKIVPGVTVDDKAVDSVRREPGYIPRPTDRRVNFSLFFQDYIPKNPTYKMHLNLVFGTGLPFGPPSHERYKDVFRMPSYKRVDIGFSKQLKKEDQTLKANSPFRHFKSIWLTLEVFNLLQIKNTISYLWITDITNRRYAIPNYLTSRRINLRLKATF